MHCTALQSMSAVKLKGKRECLIEEFVRLKVFR